MDRRTLIIAGVTSLAAPLAAPGLVRAQEAATQGPPTPVPPQPTYSAGNEDKTYSQDEIVRGVSDFMGVTAETAGGVVEKLFANNGRPTAYIAGEEGSGSFILGARYGRGLLYMKDRQPMEVFWQGPSAGWDFGGNASRVFTLCYNLWEPEVIFQRFPGVEGSAYLVGGLGVNYQKAGGVTLAPIRAGVGLRLGANVGYLSYSRKRHVLPF
ncbi:conserved hypothetical protein [Phenylobacterium zucineum HLK1]|uniref:DUF1134 domain-containing protein n=1 Tax=Phenylobacterium zucineum (strain HLK1) TaxID=450851 RepID=B4R9C9_PHEZH|nr:DUF1134 domain-containing protein [Phenylobacterium zucineum]ACG79389.1 conserved hypothetical protein [Phenylobacterium zucineum HLK1]